MSANLIYNRVASCGCYKREMLSKKQSKHRQTNTRLYGIWCAMKSRCGNNNTLAYPDYGCRGITVCEEWKNSFESFMNWANSSGYDEKLSIDRIDNDGNYCPENCRWVDSATQASNRRSNVIYEYNGVSHNISEWSKIMGISYKKLHRRLKSGWPIERALTT